MEKSVLLLVIVLVLVVSQAALGDVALKPEIEGKWWDVAGNPDLGELNGTNTSRPQQPVDFAIWRDKLGMWRIWSCIRHTALPKYTRLFFGWESKDLFAEHWQETGVMMRSDMSLGEGENGLQAPYVFGYRHQFIMLYGDIENICMAVSPDGKTFHRAVKPDGTPALFSDGEGANTRDPMVLESERVFYCYYTAWPDRYGAVYCRTSKNLTEWSDPVKVAFGGQAGANIYAGECPFVVRNGGKYYLFRTQRYGKDAKTSIYCSDDPLYFGINDDSYLLCTLPIAALRPDLQGIQIARRRWVETARP